MKYKGTHDFSEAIMQYPKCTISTDFTATARYLSGVANSATLNWTDKGLNLTTGTVSGGNAYVQWGTSGVYVTPNIYDRNPTMSIVISQGTVGSGVGEIYLGIGMITCAAGGHTFTEKHAGFKLVKAAGVLSLYATQANGTTENASSALTTLVANDVVELVIQFTGQAVGSPINYYHRKTGGVQTLTTLTGNAPTGAAYCHFQGSITNKNTTDSLIINIGGVTWQR